MNDDRLWVCRLGMVEYRAALALQEHVRAARQAGALPDVLLLLEHPAVYTRGRRSQPGELPMGEAWYRTQGIDVVATDRGGRVTYHGPGQLVGYPIMAIDDVIAYLRTMEGAIVAALADAGVRAHARPDDGPDFTGVWTQGRKIASIGVHVSRGVTTHGFAVNVHNDLEPFSWVVPCGLEDVRMTSLRRESGRGGELLAPFRERMALRFAEAFGRRPLAVAPERLEASAPVRSPA
ncbi:MAG: lipoyl(octanoyl) transferase LipB [Actinomycetota bacterium]|nr:lipoyl(octanoyl) transferase LipB [Actinomycetota bacterium]